MKLIKRNSYDTKGQIIGDFFIGLVLASGVASLAWVFAILFYILAFLDLSKVGVMLIVFPSSMGTIIVGLLIYLGITHYWAAIGLVIGLVGLLAWWSLHLIGLGPF